jgi:hypothetical protein
LSEVKGAENEFKVAHNILQEEPNFASLQNQVLTSEQLGLNVLTIEEAL